MGLGALIIQERMQLTDRETLATISENPYMQYFIGFAGLEMKPPLLPLHDDAFPQAPEGCACRNQRDAKEMDDDDDNESQANGGGMSSKAKRASKKNGSPDDVEQQTMFDEAQA